MAHNTIKHRKDRHTGNLEPHIKKHKPDRRQKCLIGVGINGVNGDVTSKRGINKDTHFQAKCYHFQNGCKDGIVKNVEKLKSEKSKGIKMVEIIKHDKTTLFLRTELATGKIKEGKFEIAMNAGGRSLLWLFPEATYLISLSSLTDDIMTFREGVKKG